MVTNLAHVPGRQPVTPVGGARAVPAGQGSSPWLPGGFGKTSGRHYDRPAAMPLDWDRRGRVTPISWPRPRKNVSGAERWRSFAAASAVVGRRQASALRPARDRIPKDADGRLRVYRRLAVLILFEHDPEKWNPVFRKDHAPLKAERDRDGIRPHRRRLMTGSGSASCASYRQNSGAHAPRERCCFSATARSAGEGDHAKHGGGGC